MCVYIFRVREVFTYLKQTFCQSLPDYRPQKGAKEKEGDFGPGDVCVIQEGPFGELQPAVATVPPCAQHGAGASGDELPVARHGLDFHRPSAAHRCDDREGKNREGCLQQRSRGSPD